MLWDFQCFVICCNVLFAAKRDVSLHTVPLCRAVLVSSASNMMCAMQDGMDQGKFRCPRSRKATSKTFSKLYRPKLHISGTWIHGKRLLLSVTDEDCKKDAACQMEQLCRAVDGFCRTPEAARWAMCPMRQYLP